MALMSITRSLLQLLSYCGIITLNQDVYQYLKWPHTSLLLLLQHHCALKGNIHINAFCGFWCTVLFVLNYLSFNILHTLDRTAHRNLFRSVCSHNFTFKISYNLVENYIGKTPESPSFFRLIIWLYYFCWSPLYSNIYEIILSNLQQ